MAALSEYGIGDGEISRPEAITTVNPGDRVTFINRGTIDLTLGEWVNKTGDLVQLGREHDDIQ